MSKSRRHTQVLQVVVEERRRSEMLRVTTFWKITFIELLKWLLLFYTFIHIMLKKISISNKCCSFKLYIHQRTMKKTPQKYKAAQLFSTMIINVSWAPNWNEFWRIMWPWRLQWWCLKFSFASTGINYNLKYIEKENSSTTVIQGQFFNLQMVFFSCLHFWASGSIWPQQLIE